ncbi:transposase [Kushneria pakistanensis]|uniref:transposase n=1 Tax=Kushneria pakistanensis TaxID=1508770 RepID=UPI001677246C
MHGRLPQGLYVSLPDPQYHQRNVVERLFGWLKKRRRLNTPYDNLVSSFRATVTLACTDRHRRANFLDRT